MSATRLLVLGIIQMAGRLNGYRVRTELMSWNADQWARIKPGSIYHAMRKAATDGLLAEIPVPGTDRVEYEITEAGERELRALVRSGLGDAGDPFTLFAALSMMTVLTRAEAIERVGARLRSLAVSQEALRRWHESPAEDTPPHVAELRHLWREQAKAEITAAEGLLERLRAGAYRMAGEPDR